MTLTDQERQARGKFVTTILNAYRDIITEGEEYLNVLGKPILEGLTKAEKPTQAGLDTLKKVEKTSSKGPYHQISKTENTNNPSFQKLQSYIKQSNGFTVLYGSKYWIFSNNPDLIGTR